MELTRETGQTKMEWNFRLLCKGRLGRVRRLGQQKAFKLFCEPNKRTAEVL
jgi:hypothetical protein